MKTKIRTKIISCSNWCTELALAPQFLSYSSSISSLCCSSNTTCTWLGFQFYLWRTFPLLGPTLLRISHACPSARGCPLPSTAGRWCCSSCTVCLFTFHKGVGMLLYRLMKVTIHKWLLKMNSSRRNIFPIIGFWIN